jgi:hypothetical protein
MDHTTLDLISAIDFLLRFGHAPAILPGLPDRWAFQEGSEIHIALTEALEQARIAVGIDIPALPKDLEPEAIAAA